MTKPHERPRLGHDGISVMVNRERALRVREVARPTAEDYEKAREALPDLLKRRSSRRRSS